MVRFKDKLLYLHCVFMVLDLRLKDYRGGAVETPLIRFKVKRLQGCRDDSPVVFFSGA